MLEVFSFSFNAVMPILLLVFLGVVLRKLKFAKDDFFKTANSLVFRVFLPVMLFYNVYKIKSLKEVNWKALIFCVLAVLAVFALGVAISLLITKRRDRLGVLQQCAFRSNHAIIGLPLAQSLGTQSAVSFAAVLSAAVIPLFNILAVFVLSYYSEKDKKPSFKKALIDTVKNPLIIGVFCGLVTLAVRAVLPKGTDGEAVFTIEKNLPFIMSAVKDISAITSPFALIVLGARFDFSASHGMAKDITAGVVMRLVLSPVIGIGGAVLLSNVGIISVTSAEMPGLISVFASPAAISSAVMVGEIGGDDQLATQLVVWTSVVSMFTIFVCVFISKGLCLL